MISLNGLLPLVEMRVRAAGLREGGTRHSVDASSIVRLGPRRAESLFSPWRET